MDATYCILWIDDQPDQLKGVVKNLEQRLNLVGLNINIKWHTDFSEHSLALLTSSLRTHSPYDLIMVDYDLGNAEKDGHLLTKRIRSNTYGDMVFYSAASDSELRERLFQQRVDGVFCMNRATLASEVFSLAQNAIRRLVHPNYMRGLVVGSVGELEALFEDSINAIMEKNGAPNDDHIREVARTSLAGYINQLQEKDLAAIETLTAKRIIKKLNLRIKVELLLELLATDGSTFCLSCHGVISRFLDEINAHRIEFAHARTSDVDGIPVFKDRNNKIWKPDDMKSLLVKIREQYQTATGLYDFFKEDIKTK